MIETDNYTQLHHYEDEDIFDVVIKLGKSFGLTFENDTFSNVQTFGDLCDVFLNLIQEEHAEDCSKQQVFYKVRNAIGATLLINSNTILPDTKLEDLFPRENRRQKMKKLQVELGIPFQILNIKSWLGWTIFMGIVASLIMFFLKWEFALSGLLIFVAFYWVEYKCFAKEFELKTVRQLTEKLVRENYIAIRRKQRSVNKKEILNVIVDTFSYDLAIEKQFLNKDEKFSWAIAIN